MKSNLEIHTLSWVKKNKFHYNGGNVSDFNKSIIISCLLANIPLTPIILEEGNEYRVLRGNDELSAILDFIGGRLVISDNEIRTNLLNEDLIGKSFNDFSDELKESFLEKDMSFSIIRKMDDRERETLLSYYSSGNVVPLREHVIDTVSDKTSKSKADIKLEKYLSHPFFTKVNISSISTDIIAQMLMVSEEGIEKDLSATNIAEFKDKLTDVPDLAPVLNYLDSSFVEKNTNLRKSHLPMVYLCAKRGLMKESCPPSKFKKVIDSFFESSIEEYKKASDARTSSKTNVNTRIRVMLEYFNMMA